MSMLPEQLLSEAVAAVETTAHRSLGSDNVVDFEELDQRVRNLESRAREAFQDAHRRLYEGIAERLERGSSLSEVERRALELLIVGEAQYYLEAENNFQDWKAELRRLVDEIRATNAGIGNEAEKLLHIQALCRDAIGVLPEITHFLRERERIQRFRQATSGDIQPADGRFLAAIIRQMVSSDRR